MYFIGVYLIALSLRRLADRHRIEFQFVEVYLLRLDGVEVDHEVGVVFLDQEELFVDEVADLHLMYESEVDAENISEGDIGLHPVDGLVVLVGELDLAVAEDGPEEEEHHNLDDWILVEVALYFVAFAAIGEHMDELDHQLLHLVAGQLHEVIRQAGHRSKVPLVRVQLLLEPLQQVLVAPVVDALQAVVVEPAQAGVGPVPQVLHPTGALAFEVVQEGVQGRVREQLRLLRGVGAQVRAVRPQQEQLQLEHFGSLLASMPMHNIIILSPRTFPVTVQWNFQCPLTL